MLRTAIVMALGLGALVIGPVIFAGADSGPLASAARAQPPLPVEPVAPVVDPVVVQPVVKVVEPVVRVAPPIVRVVDSIVVPAARVSVSAARVSVSVARVSVPAAGVSVPAAGVSAPAALSSVALVGPPPPAHGPTRGAGRRLNRLPTPFLRQIPRLRLAAFAPKKRFPGAAPLLLYRRDNAPGDPGAAWRPSQ